MGVIFALNDTIIRVDYSVLGYVGSNCGFDLVFLICCQIGHYWSEGLCFGIRLILLSL